MDISLALLSHPTLILVHNSAYDIILIGIICTVPSARIIVGDRLPQFVLYTKYVLCTTCHHPHQIKMTYSPIPYLIITLETLIVT